MTRKEKMELLREKYCRPLWCDSGKSSEYPCPECILVEKYGDGECVNLDKFSDEQLDEALVITKLSIETGNDPVNRPSHYTDGKIEVIDFIEDKKLGFCLGNAVKYIARAGKKDPDKTVEDLEKAKWYIDRRIKELQEGIV